MRAPSIEQGGRTIGQAKKASTQTPAFATSFNILGGNRMNGLSCQEAACRPRREGFCLQDLPLYSARTLRHREDVILNIAHPLPNWLFMDDAMDLAHSSGTTLLEATTAVPSSPFDATAAGSIGMPSSAPEIWQVDIGRCRARLRPGQVMIVSVVGTADAD